MTPEQYQTIQDHFLRLRELSREDCARELGDLDESIRPEVASLLDSDRGCDDFLVPPSDPSVDADGATRSFAIEQASVPTKIGRYRLLQKIGEGGHGTVFMAEQSEPIKRKVAIKLIKPGMDSKQVLARFNAEQQALAMMDHSSIAKVFDAGVTDTGSPYFVMELVKGVPIHQFCDQSNADLHERLKLYLQVCDAVHHAHRKGIIHRDIKPSNVLVTMGEGEPIAKVIDFGIAKALDQRLTQETLFTEYGQMIGTLEYMSPEQAEMSAVEIDTRSDVYSLGVLLYQLLTGETPISREQLLQLGVFEIPRLLRETEPRTPSDRITRREHQLTRVDRSANRTGLSSLPSGELDWIALKALAKDRRRRYDSVLDLARDVRRFIAGEPVEAHPPSVVYKASKALRRHWVPVAMSAVLMVGALIGLLGLGFGWQRARTAATVARQESRIAEEQRRLADASRRELAETVYSDLIESAWRAVQAEKNERAADLLDRCLPEMRGWEWSLVASQIRDSTAFKRTTDAAGVKSLDVHGQLAVCVLQGGNAEVWDLATGTLQRRMEFPTRANVARWSPDGRAIFVGTSQGKIVSVRVADGKTLATYDQQLGGVYDIQVVVPGKADRMVVGVCSGSGWAEQFSVSGPNYALTQERRWKISPRLAAICFSNDRQRLLGAGYDGQIYVMGAETDAKSVRVSGSSIYEVLEPLPGTFVALTSDSAVGLKEPSEGEGDEPASAPNDLIKLDVGASALASGPDGVIAVGGGDGALYLRDLTNDAAPTLVGEFGSAISGLAWVPFRQQYVVALSDGRVVWTNIAPGHQADMRRNTVGLVLDKRNLLVAFDGAGQLSTYDITSGELRTKQSGHERSVWSVASDEAQTMVASVGEDQQLIVWDVPNMTKRFARPIAWGVRDVCVAADGSWIASAPAPDPEHYPREGTVAIRDSRSGDTVQTLVGHENWVLKMAATPDGKRLATNGEFTNTRLWDVESGEQLVKLDYDSRAAAPQVAFDHGGNELYLGHRDGWVTAWKAGTGEPGGSWPAFGDAISGLGVTVDHRVVATSQSSSELRIYGFRQARQLASLDFGIGLLLKMQLSSDGRLLFVVDQERRLRMTHIEALNSASPYHPIVERKSYEN